jgi:hypothetical protein
VEWLTQRQQEEAPPSPEEHVVSRSGGQKKVGDRRRAVRGQLGADANNVMEQ